MTTETPAQAAPRIGSEKLIKLTGAAGRKVRQLMQRDGCADGDVLVRRKLPGVMHGGNPTLRSG